jgi:phosphate-selective porin OprO/OprP
MRNQASRWIVLLAALGWGDPLRAQQDDTLPPALDPKAAAPSGLEERLRALEEANRRLSEQYRDLQRRDEEGRRHAEERYRELERRYERLLDRLEDEPEAEPGPNSSPPVLDGRSPFPGASDDRMGDTDGLRSGLTGGSAVASRRPSPVPLRAQFDDGFVLGTLDDEWTLRFHVLDQTDFKVFMPNDMFPARSGLYIPRVRVYFEGRLTRPFEYQVSLQRSVEGVWDLLDANLNFRFSERFQILFGRTLVPYSYDWYDHLEQYFITPERGLFPLNFGLARSAGLMAHGELFDGRLQYAFGGFDGRVSGLADNNNTRDAVAYLNARPFLRTERFPALRFLNVGGSIFGGRQILPQEPLPLRTSLQSSENDEGARAASAVFLDFEPDVSPLGRRSAGAIHTAWYRRQLSLEAEWQSGAFQYAKFGRPGRPTVPISGFHVSLGYFLTGETVEDRSTVVPLRPISLHRGRFGIGAIELFARYSQLELGETVFTAGLADPGEWTRKVYMTDVGFNWYLNQFVKFYVDWQLPTYGSPVLVNPLDDRFSRQSNLFWVRCQIYY